MLTRFKKWISFKKFELYTICKAVLAALNPFWNEKGYEKEKAYVSFKLKLLQLLKKGLVLLSKLVRHSCVVMV